MPTLIAVAMVLQFSIHTDGGFAGRGLGSMSVKAGKITTERCESTLTAAEQERLCAALAAVKKLKLRDSYGHASPDAVEWTLDLGDRKTTWYDGNDLPKELEELREAAWKAHQRVVSACR